MPNLRLIHTADFHLGVGLRDLATRVHTLNLVRQEDYLKQLRAIERHAVESESDFVVIAGDVFHTPRPSGYLLDEFAKFVRSLTSHRIKVVCVSGNHDQPRAGKTEAYMKALADVGAAGLHVFGEPDACVLEGARSRKSVRFIALPYLSSQMLSEAEFTRNIHNKLRELRANELSEADYTVIVGHIYVQGAMLGSEQRLAYLSDYPLPRSILLGSDVDFVCLGHIHRRQFLDKKIAYSGSVERVDFSEEKEKKGFIQLDERGGCLEAEFLDLDCRPLVTLPQTGDVLDLVGEADVNEALKKTVRREDIPEGAILRVNARLGPRQTIMRSVLDTLAAEKRLLHLFLECTRVFPKRADSQKKGLSLKQFFEDYLQSSLSKSINIDILEYLRQEGLKIMEEVESERGR